MKPFDLTWQLFGIPFLSSWAAGHTDINQ
jgi:hypothetical protein